MGRYQALERLRGWWYGNPAHLDSLHRLLSALREAVDLSPRIRYRNHRMRVLATAFAGIVTLPLVLTAVAFLSGREHLPTLTGAVLAGVRAAPLLIAVTRPVLAWWWSLGAIVVYLVLGVMVPLSFTTSAATLMQFSIVIHVAMTVIVAWRVRPVVVAVLWLSTVVVIGTLGDWLEPAGKGLDLRLFVGLSAAGLAVVGVARLRGQTRRQLREQKALTDQERRRRARLEERTRIARELHDVVAHHMSVVAVQAEAAPYRVPDPPRELTDSFANIRENAVAALTEMRHILDMLRSDEQDPATRYTPQPGLGDLDELLDNVRSAGLRVVSLVQGQPRALPGTIELSVYRIIQEALSNALRHSPASDVEVELCYEPATIGVRVSNSPPTAPVSPHPSAGRGLLGMRERASALDGTLRAGTRDDGWFEVIASIPCGQGGSA